MSVHSKRFCFHFVSFISYGAYVTRVECTKWIVALWSNLARFSVTSLFVPFYVYICSLSFIHPRILPPHDSSSWLRRTLEIATIFGLRWIAGKMQPGNGVYISWYTLADPRSSLGCTTYRLPMWSIYCTILQVPEGTYLVHEDENIHK